jgi:hypothetical protein
MRFTAILLALATLAGAPDQPTTTGPTLTGPAGAYTVTVPSPATIRYGNNCILITWGEAPVDPVDPDDPVDPVDPVVPTPVDPETIPLAEKLFVPVFLDLDHMTPALAVVRNSDALRAMEASHNIEYRAVGLGTEAFQRYEPYLASVGLKPPAFIIQKADGTVIDQGAVTTEEALVKAVKKRRPSA